MHGILWWIIVGCIAGWLTGKILKGEGYGFFMDIVVGIAGAIAGGFLLGLVGIHGSGGVVPTVLVSVFGAVVLTWLLRALAGK